MVVRLELSHCEASPMGNAVVNLGGAVRRNLPSTLWEAKRALSPSERPAEQFGSCDILAVRLGCLEPNYGAVVFLTPYLY